MFWVRKMFFKTKSEIPEGLGFNTFGLTHLLWLLAFAVICAVSIAVYKKSNDKSRNIIRITLGVIIVLEEIVKDIVSAAVGSLGVGDLPFHLCGINILLIGFDIIKRTKTVENFLYYIGIPGAMLALLFPNWTALPCNNFFHIHSFTVHIMLVLYPLLLVSSGEIKPDIKTMPKCIALLVLMAIPVYFLNMWLGTNFMFLMDPETGNPLGLFEKYLGSHLWGFPVLLPIVMFVMYLPILVINKLKRVKPKELATANT